MLNISITISNPNLTSYSHMFSSTATKPGTSITIKYTSETESIVDTMVNNKGSSNVIKGSLVSNN